MSLRQAVTLVTSLVAFTRTVAAGPCDIYASGNTPCVAAHSTTRALYNSFNGALYQVLRASDGTTQSITPLSAGGVADSAAQDNFCTGTTCLISIIYDQSGNGNHLTQAPPGGNAQGPAGNGYDNLASAIGAPVTLNGQKAYGVFSSPTTGYRNDRTTNIATGNEAEGLYAVFDSVHYNDGCCFDYGNAETSNDDTGNGHMESIYFGTNTVWGSGAGSGPWVMADLENGLYSQNSVSQNPDDPTQTPRFVHAVVKGDTSNLWAVRGGSATSGSLTTYFSGTRPSGYYPMNKEGAIILGIGGDNSDGAQGTFYEGVMTSGYPSDETEDSVNANVQSAGYAAASYNSGPSITVGDTITFHVTTPGYTTRFISHSGNEVNTQVVSSSSNSSEQQQASWTVQTGLWYNDCYSFESVDTPGSYIRHYAFELYVDADDGSSLFAQDATFCVQAGLNGEGNSIRSWSYPTRLFRHYDDILYVASQGGPEDFDNPSSYTNDVSFVISSGFS